jgi:hypothetical protein
LKFYEVYDVIEHEQIDYATAGLIASEDLLSARSVVGVVAGQVGCGGL